MTLKLLHCISAQILYNFTESCLRIAPLKEKEKSSATCL